MTRRSVEDEGRDEEGFIKGAFNNEEEVVILGKKGTTMQQRLFKGIGRLNHIAIATRDIEASRSFYRDVLGAKVVGEIVALPDHGVNTVFIELDNVKIELRKYATLLTAKVQPLGENSPIQAFLQKNAGGGMHHVCFEKSLESIPKEYRRLGQIKSGAHGLPVIFLHPKDCGGVLIELEQKSGVANHQ